MKRDILVYEEYFAWQLVVDDDRCQGVICLGPPPWRAEDDRREDRDPRDRWRGRLYAGTTNAYACTGDGMTMALAAGVALEDMEMMQFHPTTLAPTGVLITEGCRGEGAYLLNSESDRFLKRYAPNAMELASRDVISRAEQTEIDEGRGVDGNVLLDLRHLGAEKIIERLHGTRELSMVVRGDRSRSTTRSPSVRAPTTTWAAWTRTSGAARPWRACTPPANVACVSVHGANRLGGNALMETITYGKRAGKHAADWALTHTTVEVPASVVRDAERELRDAARPHGRRAALVDPQRAGRDDARELRRLPPRGADGASRARSSPSCASATSASSSTTRATSSTAISPRRSSSASSSTWPNAWSSPVLLERRAAVRTRARTISPSATTRTTCATRSSSSSTGSRS